MTRHRRDRAVALALALGGLAATPARPQTQAPELLVTVNGKPITRAQVAERVWTRYSNAALNQMVDEMLFDEAVARWEAGVPERDKASWRREAEERFKSLREGLSNDPSFTASVRESTATLVQLRKEVELQLRRERCLVAQRMIAVTPEEVRTFYELNKERLGPPEAVRLRQILSPSQEKAREHLVALKAGADMAKLAAELSSDSAARERAGDLGWVPRGAMPPAVERALFAIRPGGLSEPIQFPQGWAVFKVEDKRARQMPAFDAVAKDIERNLLEQKRNAALPQFLASLRAAARIVPGPGVKWGPPPTPAPPDSTAAP